ncbi:GMP synthase [Acinetobacter silvestris]|uniref:GMP synthase n=2 Tax=Acinetobacter silvestris TaxID=1977882 RepID=A0A1Y3CQN2_9GAMM|nr:GMP synthase [Acinetobacter silvestris]
MKKLKVHYFQHIAGEGFGSCYPYLKAMGGEISATEFFALPKELNIDIDALPNIADVDLLIIMGGAMSVNDEANFPWLKIEKRWIRRYLASQKPAIGLCLGAQLIANALGARITKNPIPELGWSAVHKTVHIDDTTFPLPNDLEVMQWHHETLELPKGAIRLAESKACLNQIYQIGKNVLGFQFHPEITPEGLSLFIKHEEELNSFHECAAQQLPLLRQTQKQRFTAGNQMLHRAIDYVLRA